MPPSDGDTPLTLTALITYNVAPNTTLPAIFIVESGNHNHRPSFTITLKIHMYNDAPTRSLWANITRTPI